MCECHIWLVPLFGNNYPSCSVFVIFKILWHIWEVRNFFYVLHTFQCSKRPCIWHICEVGNLKLLQRLASSVVLTFPGTLYLARVWSRRLLLRLAPNVVLMFRTALYLARMWRQKLLLRLASNVVPMFRRTLYLARMWRHKLLFHLVLFAT
jgi:hypothetical protein